MYLLFCPCTWLFVIYCHYPCRFKEKLIFHWEWRVITSLCYIWLKHRRWGGLYLHVSMQTEMFKKVLTWVFTLFILISSVMVRRRKASWTPNNFFVPFKATFLLLMLKQIFNIDSNLFLFICCDKLLLEVNIVLAVFATIKELDYRGINLH